MAFAIHLRSATGLPSRICSRLTTVKKKSLKNTGSQCLAAAKSPDEQTRLAREVKATDAEIDRLVYELSGLTAAEIAIVEGGASPA